MTASLTIGDYVNLAASLKLYLSIQIYNKYRNKSLVHVKFAF